MGHAGAGDERLALVAIGPAVTAADRHVLTGAERRGFRAGAGGVRCALADTFIEDAAEILCALNAGEPLHISAAAATGRL